MLREESEMYLLEAIEPFSTATIEGFRRSVESVRGKLGKHLEKGLITFSEYRFEHDNYTRLIG